MEYKFQAHSQDRISSPLGHKYFRPGGHGSTGESHSRKGCVLVDSRPKEGELRTRKGSVQHGGGGEATAGDLCERKRSV